MTTDNRTPIQNEAFKKLFKYNNLLLRWGTGVGKTRVAVLACDYILDRELDPQILLLVAERSHKDNWRIEFEKFLGKKRAQEVLKYVIIECYASMHKYKSRRWDLAIFDECHHLQSEKRQEILETMEADYVLALSATPGEAVIQVLEEVFGKFKISRISLQKAIDEEFLPEPRIEVIPLELERFRRTETIEVDMSSRVAHSWMDIWSNRWSYFKNRKRWAGYRIIFKCTQKEKYDYINEQFDYWKRMYFRNQGNIRLKNNWLQWGSRRKRYLGELKTGVAGELADRLRNEGKRFICFCTSIDQANALGQGTAVHSDNRDSFELIKKFNDLEISSLFAVRMFVEGQNLTQLDDGIIIQLDGNERQFIQKSGRMFRSKEPHIHIFYYKDTRDEEYLQKALEGINEKYVEFQENLP